MKTRFFISIFSLIHVALFAAGSSGDFDSWQKEVFKSYGKHRSLKESRAFQDWFHAQYALDRTQLAAEQSQIPPEQRNVPFSGLPNGLRPELNAYLEARKFLFSIPIEKILVDDLIIAGRLLTANQALSTRSKRVRISDSEDVYFDLPRFQSFHGVTLGGQINDFSQLAFSTPFFKKESREFAALSGWRVYPAHLSVALQNELLAAEKRHVTLDADQEELNLLRQKMIREIWNSHLVKLKEETGLAARKSLSPVADMTLAVANYAFDMLAIEPVLSGNDQLVRLTIERFLHPIGRPLWLKWTYRHLTKHEFWMLLEDSIDYGKLFLSNVRNQVDNRVPIRRIASHLVFDLKERTALNGLKLEDEQLYDLYYEFVAFMGAVKNPIGWNFQQLLDKFFNGVRTHAYPINEADSIEPRAVRPAIASFVDTFGIRSKNADQLHKKLTAYYDEAMVYRGVPWNYRPKHGEMLRMMIEPDSSLTGMGIDYKSLVKKRVQIFDEFNRMIYNNPAGLAQILHDHADASSHYFNSQLVSWSTNPGVAMHFASRNFGKADSSNDFKTLVITHARSRRHAALKTYHELPGLHAKGVEAEKEILFWGGTDPESVSEIYFIDVQNNGDDIWYQGAATVINRLNHNQIKLVEYRGNISKWKTFGEFDMGWPVREETFEILANGTFKSLEKHLNKIGVTNDAAEVVFNRVALARKQIEKYGADSTLLVPTPPDYFKFLLAAQEFAIMVARKQLLEGQIYGAAPHDILQKAWRGVLRFDSESSAPLIELAKAAGFKVPLKNVDGFLKKFTIPGSTFSKLMNREIILTSKIAKELTKIKPPPETESLGGVVDPLAARLVTCTQALEKVSAGGSP
jgi:hypothetical protein